MALEAGADGLGEIGPGIQEDRVFDSKKSLLRQSDYFGYRGPISSLREKKEVTFAKSENYCICIIDIVGSTQITSKIYKSEKIGKFYSTFINEIATIVKKHNGIVIKTVGDGVISYFPDTSNSQAAEAFKDVLECSLEMISSRSSINLKLFKEGLPGISYRVSLDYGKVEVARSGTSTSWDLFGPTVNFCAKINKIAPDNGIIIGDDLHIIISSFPSLHSRYHFHQLQGMHFHTGKLSYPLYLLNGRTEQKKGTVDSIWTLVKENKLTRTARPLTVMLVDDDPSILMLFTQYLEGEGMIVDSFSDPEKALQHFVESNPSRYDLIITDVRMRHLNGFELYCRLKSLDPKVRVVFVTALDIAEEVTSILPEVSTEQFITKPIRRDQLIKSVKEHTRL
jgi:two-component system, OmpR family, response regulator ChvI